MRKMKVNDEDNNAVGKNGNFSFPFELKIPYYIASKTGQGELTRMSE